MKKVLFATSALVATAGIASADIAITGSAEMGVAGGDVYGLSTDASTVIAGNDDMRFHQGYTINFAMSSTTDAGLAFGANIRLDMDGNADQEHSGPSADAGTVFISGAFGKLTMGDTDGAADWALSEMALAGGSINDAETSHAGYNGNGLFDGSNDDQVLRYEYSMGNVAFAISHEQAANGQSSTLDDNNGIGIKYTVEMGGGTLALGAGYMTGTRFSDRDGNATTVAYQLAATDLAAIRHADEYSTGDAMGISAVYTMSNGLTIGANYANMDLDATRPDLSANDTDEITAYGLGVAYTTGAWTFAANYGSIETDNRTAADVDNDGYGLVANYDLGGGATFQFGYGESDRETGADTDSVSAGIAMSF